MNIHPSQLKALIPHRHVQHPSERLRRRNSNRLVAANDAMLDWVSTHILASMLMFDVALIIPLAVIPLADSVKITLGVVSGSWIQWWALPALQRSQMKTDLKREAKADSDHAALTHIANTVDAILSRLECQPGQGVPAQTASIAPAVGANPAMPS